MTPEQLAEVVEVIRRQNWFLVTCGVLSLTGPLTHLWLPQQIEAAIADKQHFVHIELLRCNACGRVDDGGSALLGRRA